MEQQLGSSSEQILVPPVPGGRALTTAERDAIDLSGRIPGWGSDLDPATRPGIPRDPAPELGHETLYPPIEQQVPVVRIHKSTEHARLTPVFGTTSQPDATASPDSSSHLGCTPGCGTGSSSASRRTCASPIP